MRSQSDRWVVERGVSFFLIFHPPWYHCGGPQKRAKNHQKHHLSVLSNIVTQDHIQSDGWWERGVSSERQLLVFRRSVVGLPKGQKVKTIWVQQTTAVRVRMMQRPQPVGIHQSISPAVDLLDECGEPLRSSAGPP